MTADDAGDSRLVAWGQELRAVHQRLRDALDVARESIGGGATPSLSGDLLLFCHGFCHALDGHHRSEDDITFPLVVQRHPELAPVVAQLMQDHSTIRHLIRQLEHDLGRAADAEVLRRHLDGIEAVMETHFRYEERQLIAVLDRLPVGELDKTTLFGPIA
jgi:hemerythrin-like domain-containing protein